jgi:hypothetical protein
MIIMIITITMIIKITRIIMITITIITMIIIMITLLWTTITIRHSMGSNRALFPILTHPEIRKNQTN